MSEFREPTYLSEPNDEPIQKVRCPIHGFIRYSANERKVIDHPLFRRLRHIKQLALTEYAYPGANHTRFEHSLGVMELATQAFDRLIAKHGRTLEKEFNEVFKEGKVPDALARARQLIRITALLHDTGHAPFSHAAEKVLHGTEGHEAQSIRIATEADLLGEEIDSTWGEGMGRLVGQILKKDSDLAPQLMILRDLISGEADADRMDYLLRDAYHCGVGYGKFDHLRLLESMTLVRDEDRTPGALLLALDKDGLHAFESLILARYQMSTQVYFHKIRRIYDHYLDRYHGALISEGELKPEDLMQETDITMMTRIMVDAGREDDSEVCKYAKRIAERHHHKPIWETGLHTARDESRRVQKLAGILKNKYTGVDYVVDAPDRPHAIHKLSQPKDLESDGVDFFVLDRNGTKRSICSESQVLSELPKFWRTVRIFVDVDDRKLRNQMEMEAINLWPGM